jgi:hypothetical protein
MFSENVLKEYKKARKKNHRKGGRYKVSKCI